MVRGMGPGASSSRHAPAAKNRPFEGRRTYSKTLKAQPFFCCHLVPTSSSCTADVPRVRVPGECSASRLLFRVRALTVRRHPCAHHAFRASCKTISHSCSLRLLVVSCRWLRGAALPRGPGGRPQFEEARRQQAQPKPHLQRAGVMRSHQQPCPCCVAVVSSQP